MTKDEALKMALEALEEIKQETFHPAKVFVHNHAITAIKEALAQPKQEPVVTKNENGMTLHFGWEELPVGTKLYVSPQAKPWVGLTDEDLSVCDEDGVLLAKYWEAKLKEKNR